MRNHNLAARGIAARGDKCRAPSRGQNRAARWRPLPLVQPGHVVLRQLDASVQRHNIPHVQLHAFRLHPFGNALQLLLVLGVNVRPQHLAPGLAEKIPIARGVVRGFKLDYPHQVLDLGSK